MITDPPQDGPISTPRVPPLPRDEWSDAARDVFEYWEGPTARQEGSRSNTMMTLANHPALALATLDLGRYFMLNAKISPRHLKFIVLRVAHRYGSTYQWTHNCQGARQLGVTDAEIEAIKAGPNAAIWSPADRALLLAIDGTGDGGCFDDAIWAELTRHFERQALMDIIHATGYFTMVAWGLIALNVQVESDFASFSQNRARNE